MKMQRSMILLCAAAIVLMALPAFSQSYSTECENILAPADGWSICSGSSDGTVASAVTRLNATDPYAYGGSGLKIIDTLTADDTAKLFIRGLSPFPFSNQATVVVRMKTTADAAFTSTPWSRNVVLTWVSSSTTKRSAGLAIHPDGACLTNSNGTTFYPSAFTYPCDNTHFATWTICATFDDSAKKVNADVYRDGVKIISVTGMATSPESPIVLNSPSNKGYDAVALGSSPNACTGSYLFDRVAYKPGIDPTWQPWGAPTGSISGVISKSGDPSVKLSGATVVLRKGQDVIGVTKAGSDGAYSFTGLEPEAYIVSATAEGYFDASSDAAVTSSAPSGVSNVGMVAIPASGAAVYDGFDEPYYENSALSTTEDAQHLPWIVGDEIPEHDYALWGDGVLTVGLGNEPLICHGYSIGGGFLPANVDISVDLGSMSAADPTSYWGGIAYRQTLPCTFDNFNGQNLDDAGYLVRCSVDGKNVKLWRQGRALGQAATNIDWANDMHRLRVLAFGPYHEVQVDGIPLFHVYNNEKMTGGYVGVLRDQANMFVDNFQALPLANATTLGSLSGSVYASASPATKLAGARLTLSDGRTVITDASGNYSVELQSFDSLTISAKYTGYLDKSVVVNPAMGANTANVPMDLDVAYRPTIAEAKAAGVGNEVAIAGKVIAAQWSGTTMYVVEPNRGAGIKVALPGADSNLYRKISECVDIRGVLRADATTGELYIQASSIYEPDVPKVFLKPVAMNGRTVLDKSAGTDITGLDVKVVGQVTAVNDPTDFTINDGAGDLKVVVDSSIGWDYAFVFPQVGDYVSVEGIVSLDGTAPGAVRCIKPWHTNGNMLKAHPTRGWIAGFESGGFSDNFWSGVDPWPGYTDATFTFLQYDTTGLARPTSKSGTYYLEMVSHTPWVGTDNPATWSGSSVIATYTRSDDVYSTPIWDCEYEASVWARGTGVGAAGVNGLYSYGLYLPGSGVLFPAGDFDWQKFAISWRYEGSNWRGANPTYMVISTQMWDVGTIDIDDYFLGYARGTVKQIDPVRY